MAMNQLDQFQGCLIGGAVGDALGYPIEFDLLHEIQHQYGSKGLSHYVLSNGVAQISDDTQMTLFTANALLCAEARTQTHELSEEFLQSIMAVCYQEWLQTQHTAHPIHSHHSVSWLLRVPELFHQRAPGNTCLSAIAHGAKGTIERPINQSKGCGGIMRVAPIGLYFSSPEQAGIVSAQNAAMTHGHELGYIPAGVFGYCISSLVHQHSSSLLDIISCAMAWAAHQFPHTTQLQKLNDLVRQAIQFSQGNHDDTTAISLLGEGWVAEETLAIALYSALKYENEFERGLFAAVNHDGDSDSTGAVTGNLLGAIHGLSGIPVSYLEHLELKTVILTLADDLYHSYLVRSDLHNASSPTWQKKYQSSI